MLIATTPGGLSRRAAVTGLYLGLPVMIAGTFLPWLQSGRTTRNSYAGAAQLRQFLQSSGGTDVALRSWAGAAILASVALLLVIAGRLRSGAVVALVGALVTGAVAAAALHARSAGTVRPVGSGPGWTLAGAALTCAAAAACLILSRPTSRRFR